jgi:hypothetical protein
MRSSRPPLRNCPFCKIAMVAMKAEGGKAGYGRFECLTCGTTIAFDDTTGRDDGIDRPAAKD